MEVKRGNKILVKAEAVPDGALDNTATVIFGCLVDEKTDTTYHKVMFNAGIHGVIFKTILDTEVDRLGKW